MVRICIAISMLLLLMSCVSEQAGPSANAGPEEKNYFEDYEVPELKWGYIDKTGKTIIPAIYDQAREFSEGRAAVNFKGKWAYIDSRGNQVVEPRFIEARDFNEGLAFARTFPGEWLLLDLKGDEVMSGPFKDVRDFRYGIGSVLTEEGWQLIDPQGKFYKMGHFESVIPVSYDTYIFKQGGQYGIANLSGSQILEAGYNGITAGGPGIYILKKHNLFYYVDALGVYHGPFKKALPFQDGKTVIKDSIGYYVLDSNFDKLRHLRVDDVTAGGQGFWYFRKGSRWGILQNDGFEIIEPRFDVIHRFTDNRAVCAIDDNWGYIDTSGRFIIDPVLPLAWDYKEGLARFIAYGGFGVLDTMGHIVIPPQFEELRDFSEGLARFGK